MLRSVLTALLCCFAFTLSAQITVSDNQRYLLRNGRPFFWLGDTAWELFHRLNRRQADQYLQHRAEQGFTVIQAVILAEFDGLHTPNAYGDVPLQQDDPTRPNEAYFKHVDYIIDKADSLGLVIGLLPTWGDKVWKASWGKGHVYWQQAMDLPGARQMQYLRKLMEANPLTERVPDQSLVVENDLPPAERIQATRGRDYAYIYTCAGRPFTVNLGKINGRTLSTGWFNPRTGRYQLADTVANTGQRKFTPPAAGYGQDWVLVLQDTARRIALQSGGTKP